LWIADETQCGLGRTGRKFAYQWHPEARRPDIVVTAKPLAAGIPLGAAIFNERAAAAFGEGLHGTTFGGGPLACRVAIAFLREAESLLPSIEANGGVLHEELRGIAASSGLIREVRGRGLMAGIELHVSGEPFVEAALERGLVINCTHGNVIRLLPPFIVNESQIRAACAILRALLI